MKHESILLGWDGDLGLDELISGNVHVGSLGASEVLVEFTCVLVTVGETDLTSINGDVSTNCEVLGHEGVSWVVLVEKNVSLEEGSLRNSTVLLLGFHEHH